METYSSLVNGIDVASLYEDNVLKYDDRSNDNDSFSSLRYSVRGPKHILIPSKELGPKPSNCGKFLRASITKLY